MFENVTNIFPLIAVYAMYISSFSIVVWGLPGGSDGKASACNAGDLGFDPWVEKIPWRRKWQPTPVLLPGKLHGQRSLVGYWGSQRVGHDWVTSLSFLSFFLLLFLVKTTPLKNKTVIFIDTFKDWWRNTQKPVSWKTNKTFLQSKKVHSWVGGADNWQEDWSRGIWRKRGGGREGRREKEKLPFTISGCKGKFMFKRWNKCRRDR